MITIGICGASGCGKSTLAKALVAAIDRPCVLLSQDSYYRDNSHLPFHERERINYDEPGAFEHDQLLRDLRALKAGQSIARKGYDFANHRRADPGDPIAPCDVVIVEGIHCFYDENIREALDFKLYIRVDADVCLLRRVKRDIIKRGRQIEGIYAQYLSTVKPMFDRYISTYIDHADIIVAGGGKNQRIVDVLAAYIEKAL